MKKHLPPRILSSLCVMDGDLKQEATKEGDMLSQKLESLEQEANMLTSPTLKRQHKTSGGTAAFASKLSST